jgi:hypothetical protein
MVLKREVNASGGRRRPVTDRSTGTVPLSFLPAIFFEKMNGFETRGTTRAWQPRFLKKGSMFKDDGFF